VSSAAADPYLDPASGVLRNLLGITDKLDDLRCGCCPAMGSAGFSSAAGREYLLTGLAAHDA
jgi:hypothetical protein